MTATTEKLEASKKPAHDYIEQVFKQHDPDKADKAAGFVAGDVTWHGGTGHWLPAAARMLGLDRAFGSIGGVR